MRYSVVLPRIDPADTEAVRQALEQARVSWAKGAHPEAVELVRAASEAARAAGSDQRAIMLGRATEALRRQIEPQTENATAVTARPPKAKQKLVLAEGPSGAQPRATERARRTSARSRPTAPGLPVSAPHPPASAQPPSSAERLRASEQPAPSSTSSPTIEITGLDDDADRDGEGAGELVVTVAPADWKLPSHEALVGRRAVRVAIVPGKTAAGTITVRPLAAGEVAPAGAQVALLVALEPDALPLPRTA